jgi:hypothetical protein
MTQPELRAIIDNYNFCIDRYAKQTQEQQGKLKNVRERIEDKQGVNRRYFQEREDILIDTENMKNRQDVNQM